jgi:hypothetical protein
MILFDTAHLIVPLFIESILRRESNINRSNQANTTQIIAMLTQLFRLIPCSLVILYRQILVTLISSNNMTDLYTLTLLIYLVYRNNPSHIKEENFYSQMKSFINLTNNFIISQTNSPISKIKHAAVSSVAYLSLNYFNLFTFAQGTKLFFSELFKHTKPSLIIHPPADTDLYMIDQSIHVLQNQQRNEEQREQEIEQQKLYDQQRAQEIIQSENTRQWITNSESEPDTDMETNTESENTPIEELLIDL